MMKILIVKLSAIGDVVQTLPALEAIKKVHPHSEITWVVEDAASGILEGHPMINRLLISRRKGWAGMLVNPLTIRRAAAEIMQFVRQVRDTEYDIAVDFQGLLKSGAIIGIARAKRKIGFDRTREFSYKFLNERMPAYDIDRHALERYLDIARYFGAVNPSQACALPIEREIEVVKERLGKIMRSGEPPLVVVNPMARWKTKLWPEKKFAELADRLISEKKAFVIFTGSAEDREAAARIRCMMREYAENWAGKTSLKEMAALASLSSAFVSTDTGPMHIAAAAGARVIALFGPTAPWRTGPYGPSHAVVRTGIECSPCFKRECDRGFRCMNDITVDEVMKKIEN